MQKYFASILCLVSLLVFSQEEQTNSYFDFNYFKGNIALHNNNILGLIAGRPEGVVLSWNKKTFGDEAWEQRYNYPDYGGSLIFQNLNNDVLGHNVGLFAHYNFYFLKRNLMLRLGQGLAYASNPYNRIDNPKNIAFGSTLLGSAYLMLNYKKERIIDRFGLQAGLLFIHYSNASVRSPNTSVNVMSLNIGVTYNLDDEDVEYIDNGKDEKYTEPIRYNFAFRSGINQSDVVGSNQYPFYILSAYADKRLSRKSAIQFGADVFFSNFLKELISFQSTGQFNNGVTGNEDFKRVGLFAGHELFINKLSIETQLGYYIYYPFDFEGRTYLRIGLKRYFTNKLFGAITLKSHGAKAEAVEFGIGLRL